MRRAERAIIRRRSARVAGQDRAQIQGVGVFAHGWLRHDQIGASARAVGVSRRGAFSEALAAPRGDPGRSPANHSATSANSEAASSARLRASICASCNRRRPRRPGRGEGPRPRRSVRRSPRDHLDALLGPSTICCWTSAGIGVFGTHPVVEARSQAGEQDRADHRGAKRGAQALRGALQAARPHCSATRRPTT